jgi:hypothetical protein
MEKSADEFANDKLAKDGKYCYCKACSAKKRREWGKKTKEDTKPLKRFMRARRAAKERNLSWSIELLEYKEILKNCCHYCQSDISQETGSGLDRKQNDLGYTADNVLTCCGKCNLSRNENFTVEEWKIAMEAIKKFRKECT